MAQLAPRQEPIPKKKKILAYGYLLLLAITISGALFFLLRRYPGFLTIFTDQPNIRKFIANYGMRAPFILISLQVFQIIIAPIPGHFVGFASGYLFGAVKGTIYCVIGIIIGASVTFSIGRIFGRRLLELFISQEKMQKFDNYIIHRGPFVIFLLLLIPIAPLGDFIYYLSGLTAIPFFVYLIMVIIARIPNNFVYNLIGAKAFTFAAREWIIFGGVLIILALLFYLNRKRIEHVILRFAKY